LLGDFAHKYWQEKLIVATKYFIPQNFPGETPGGCQKIIYKNHGWENT